MVGYRKSAIFLVPSICQAKHLLGFKLGHFTNYPKAYMHLKIRLLAPSEMFMVGSI